MKQVAVIGAGLMGHALALVYALGGCRVRLQDVSEEALVRARGLIATGLETLAEAGFCSAADKRAVLEERLLPTPRLDDAVADAELVVEAVFENTDVKRQVFTAIDRAAPASAIIASNTSYLEIFPLVPERRLPRTLIAHWYTPPYIVDLVDVVPGPRTERWVVEAVRDQVRGFGKHPIVMKRFIPGFIANRIQAAISLEVYALLDDGFAEAAEIDDAVRYGLALRLPILGHLKKADYTGLEMVQRALANRSYEPPELRGECATLDRLIASGRTGVMAGKGFYDYAGQSPESLFQERDRKILRLKKLLQEMGEM
jgi:3-hydroxybutyryl-CoA dehydrogenase